MGTTLGPRLADRPLLWVFREGLQAFTPDRHADVYAAMISASGAMAAILPADFLIRAPKLAYAATDGLALRCGTEIAGIGRPGWSVRNHIPSRGSAYGRRDTVGG